MDTRTDSDLMAAYVKACDEGAFAELVARHQRMVYRVCLRMLRHHQEAEDATQAVFLVLLNKASRLTRKGELTGWLYGVARNVCLEALRKRARRQEEAMLDENEVPAVEECRPDHEEVMPFLDEELAGLSGVLRQAVILRYLQNHSESEAAQRVGCAVGTLSARASRGIERLRQRLAKRGVALSGVALAGLLTSEASAAVPETLLPSILATVKTAVATTATATGATTTAAMLAKGAMKAMFIAKVKMVAAVAAASLVVAGSGAIVAQEVAAQREATTQQVTAEKDATKPEPMRPAITSAPMIENMQIELVYPIDARKKPQEIKGIQDRITAMAGTRVNLGFVFTQPLKSAVLTFDDQIRMPLDVVGRFASVSFVHSQARSAKLQVEDVNGLALEKPHAMEFGLMAGEAQAVYEKAGKTAEAVAAYRATLKKYPGTPEADLAHRALEKMGSRSPDADHAPHMPLAGKAAELEKKAQEAKVTLSLKEMSADNALDMLSMRSGITIRKTDIPKDAKITLEMRGASVLDGVQRVTEMLGLTYVIVDDAIEVSGKKKE